MSSVKTSLSSSDLTAFVRRVAPQIRTSGQSYDTLSLSGVTIEVAWYREANDTWQLWLAAEHPGRRVESDGDMELKVLPDTSAQEIEAQLSQLLRREVAAMLSRL